MAIRLIEEYDTNKNGIYAEYLINNISSYDNICVTNDRDVVKEIINTDYFLSNDVWNIDFFMGISQFKEYLMEKDVRYKNIVFSDLNHMICVELKYFMHYKLFGNLISIGGFFGEQATSIHRLRLFLIEVYPEVNSILNLDPAKANLKWLNWLSKNNISTTRVKRNSDKVISSSIANFFTVVYSTVEKLSDTRVEWEKDVWDVRNLSKYGVRYAKTSAHFTVNFGKINNVALRENTKVYFKKRMLNGNKMTWKTLYSYMSFLPIFLNYISEKEPTWNTLEMLNRKHLEDFYIWMKLNIFDNENSKITNTTDYQRRMITSVKTYLSGLYDNNSEIAPKDDVRKIIIKSDLPKVNKGSKDSIKYIADVVLEQLFEHINDLNPEVTPIIWIMYKTGLRITDVLELNHDCLVKINGEFWIVTDIEKVYVSNHRIPIDDELASMIAVLIDKSKTESNKLNNPSDLIFGVYSGSRTGLSHATSWVNDNLNVLSKGKNIVDENNKLFKFHNHAFRHTYAVKMLNNGVDILTLQNLLAHASPEMTLRYAKLLDNTKRKAFDKAVKSGAFTMNKNLELDEFDIADIDDGLLKDLWTNHKLNAVNTPYGTCMQRGKGACDYAKAPPCLVGNGGSPCKDLFIGACGDDKDKYQILLNTSKSLIDIGKKYNRPEIIQENTELLSTYTDILDKLNNGDIIYGRLDRLKKK